MTYTFKLSRRLAQLWHAAVVAVALLPLSCTSTDGGPIEPPPVEPGILLSPDSTSVGVNEAVQFEAMGAFQRFSVAATLSGGSILAASSLSWSATGGTIDLTGKYTAGTVPGRYRVIAHAWSGMADTAVVTIVALAGITVTPASMTLQPGATQQFSVGGKMTDSSSTAVNVTWTASGGTISPTGVYTAGPNTGSYRAIAVQVGGNLADTAALSITAQPPPPPPPVPQPGVPILPGQSIQAAVNANSAGTTFLIKIGRHVRQSVVPKNGNTFRCEAGAILDGETVTPYAFMRSGANPDDVRIVGCVIERYAPPAQMGAILAGGNTASDGTSGWIVDSTEVRNNANLGIRLGGQMKVRWSNVHHNGQLGIGGVGDDILIEGNEIAYNNPNNLGNLDFEAGGTKFVLTNRLIVRNNFVHHNTGPGLWTDIDNDATLFEGNLVEDNLREGIITEISYSAIIRNNTVRRNGLNDSRSAVWVWGAGIGIHASGGTGIEIYGNVLEGNAHGIALIQQNRACGVGGGNCRLGSYLVQNVTVHDNTVKMATGATGAVTDSGDNAIFTSRNNRFTNNTYVITGNARPFAWMNAYRTEAEWKGFGQDAAGTFIR